MAAGCSWVAVFSGSGSGLGVLGSICIFSAMGCSRSGGGYGVFSIEARM